MDQLQELGERSGMGERVRFEILGPIRCYVGAQEVPVTSVRDRAFLAILLLHAGEPVPLETLIDAIWGERLPRDARGQVQSCVWRLRKQLAHAGGSRDVIATNPVGYHVAMSPGSLDLHEFRRLRDDARTATSAGSHAEASDRYREALAHWRGPALAGIDNPAIRGAATSLGEERAQALEEYLDAKLASAKASEVIPELTELVRKYPYREKLHGVLMLALYRAGRQADALAAYQRARELVKDELGTEPGEDLRTLHRAILNRDSRLDQSHTPAAGYIPPSFRPLQPRNLPPDIPDFVGRDAELIRVRSTLAYSHFVQLEQAAEADKSERDATRHAIPILVVTGPPGVGKTAFSTHVAHALQDEYPDGQLYVDLRGFDENPPATPSEVLGRFLRSLGVSGSSMPEPLEERVDLFRQLLSELRILVVLDNAAADEQVYPLIPGSPACGVLINSRLRLGSSFGAVAIDLNPLDTTSAASLVTRIVGSKRTEPEHEAVVELVRLCDHLPLAIRVAAARLASKPHWGVSQLVSQLRNQRRRLDYLALGSLDMRASITLSYSGLHPEAQQLLRMLGSTALPEFSSWVSAALLNTDPAGAEERLEQLVDARLVEASGRDPTGHARYRLHDLVQLFAAERAGREGSPAELHNARSRMLGAWLFAADLMNHHAHGARHLTVVSDAPRWPFAVKFAGTLTASPLRWFDIERSLISAVVRIASADGLSTQCWDLANITAPLYQIRGYYDERQRLLELALTKVRPHHDVRGCAALLYRLGAHHTDLSEFRDATEYLRKAAALFATCGDRHGNAVATAYLAMISRFRRRYDKAVRGYQRAATILRESSDPGGEAFALRGIGQVYLDQADYSQADLYLGRALDVCQRHGMRRGKAQVLVWQGMLRLRQGRYREAESLLNLVLYSCRELEDPTGQAQALRGIGLSHLQRGQLLPAKSALLEALRLVVQPRPTLLEDFIRRDLARLDPASVQG